jgi:DNA-binding CsgD family transcriptional regulator
MKAEPGAYSPELSDNLALPVNTTTYLDAVQVAYAAGQPGLVNNHGHPDGERVTPGQDVTVLVVIVGKLSEANSALVHCIERIPGVNALARVTDYASIYTYDQRGDAAVPVNDSTISNGPISKSAAGNGAISNSPINDGPISNGAEEAEVTAGAAASQTDGLCIERLSSRELEVFQMLSRGMSNRQLARSLGITERTVKAHIGSIMRKLGLQSRLQVGLAALARHPDGVDGQALLDDAG